MDSMSTDIILFAEKLIKEGEGFVVAKVVDTSGSAPRKKGAWLIMREDGTSVGTVGGGKLEAETEKLALSMFGMDRSKPIVHQFKLQPGATNSLDMRCGGDVDISIEYIDANNANSFIKEFNLNSKAYIFGAGHVGLALEPVLRYVGFSTIVIDDREEYANKTRFPAAEKCVVIKSYKDAFENLQIDENSYIIIVTRGHEGDYDVLRQSLQRPNAYIGMIGSKKKVLESFRILIEEGFKKEELDAVYSPVGVSIKAETPEEIAISIVAEMIKVRAENEK